MIRRIWFIVILTFFTCTAAQTAELSFEKSYYLPAENARELSEYKILLTETNSENGDKIISEIAESVIFQIDFGPAIKPMTKTYLVDLSKTLPSYIFHPIEIEIPFYAEGKKIDIVLVSVNSQAGDRKEIAALRDVNPMILDDSLLFEYHARAAQQAEYVIRNFKTYKALRRDDVKAVYSYLQSARELAYKKFVVENRGVYRAGNWLETASDKRPSVVENAVGLTNAKQVISQIAELKKYRYETQWRKILQLKYNNFERYCSYLGTFQNKLLSLTEAKLQEINSGKLTAFVGTAFANCIAEGVRFGRFNHKELHPNMSEEGILEKQINILKEQEGVAGKWHFLRSLIEGHILDLTRIKKDISQQK